MNKQVLLAILSVIFTGVFLASGIYQVVVYSNEPMSWFWLVGSIVTFGANLMLVWKRK